MSGKYDWKLGQRPPLLGAHSVAKHDIFEQYIKIYIERLTRTPAQTTLNLTIVDGFSGGGLYQVGSRQVDGSPLRLLTAVNAGMASRPAGPRSADTRGMNSRPAIGGSDWDGRLGRTGRKVRLPGLVDRTSYAACP